MIEVIEKIGNIENLFEYPQSTGNDLREVWSRNIQDIDYLSMTDRK